MCMFGYLKTPDIILPLVSSRKLDWTHTFDTHCSKFEVELMLLLSKPAYMLIEARMFR